MIEKLAKENFDKYDYISAYKLNDWEHIESYIRESYENHVKEKLLPIIRAKIQAVENPYNTDLDNSGEIDLYKYRAWEEARESILKLFE